MCGLEEGIGHGGWGWEVRDEKGSQRLWRSNPLISQIRKARPRVISSCIPIRYQSLVQVQGLVWSKMSHFSGKNYLWVVYQAGFRSAASNKGRDKAKEAESVTGREWRAGHKGMGEELPQARDGAGGVSWALVPRNFQFYLFIF